jgi:protein gp37
MGDKSSIEWTEASWNVVTGCDRVSPGCQNCYALTMAARLKRMGQANYQTDGDPRTSGPGFGVAEHPHMLDQPLRWKRPRRIFVNSMSDLFHQEVTADFIASVFAIMAACPQHTFQILTKRPQRMAFLVASPEFEALVAKWVEIHDVDMNPALGWDGVRPLPGVWLGTSIESDRYTFRADHLRATPAAVRFISAEPLLGPLPSLDLGGIKWLIAGAESGHGARPMAADWVRDLRDRCAAAGVPLFVKQLSGGTHAVKDMALFPEDLRIREFPATPTPRSPR